jgi:hypothetical protein
LKRADKTDIKQSLKKYIHLYHMPKLSPSSRLQLNIAEAGPAAHGLPLATGTALAPLNEVVL